MWKKYLCMKRNTCTLNEIENTNIDLTFFTLDFSNSNKTNTNLESKNPIRFLVFQPKKNLYKVKNKLEQ